jgi:CMP/dCMP kinase
MTTTLLSQLHNDIVIAIDGYSSCGKSSFAKTIAGLLNYAYVDSGAMYRATTLFMLKNNGIVNGDLDLNRLDLLLLQVNITFKYNADLGFSETYLNNELVERDIRTLEISDNVSNVSKNAQVRKKMVELQRQMGKAKRIVMDGRDIGSVVFPDAELKIFMTADTDIRAQRRYKELLEKDEQVSLQEIKENLEKRDYIDTHREESPLIQPKDAIVLDNSYLTPQEQLVWIKPYIIKASKGNA